MKFNLPGEESQCNRSLHTFLRWRWFWTLDDDNRHRSIYLFAPMHPRSIENSTIETNSLFFPQKEIKCLPMSFRLQKVSVAFFGHFGLHGKIMRWNFCAIPRKSSPRRRWHGTDDCSDKGIRSKSWQSKFNQSITSVSNSPNSKTRRRRKNKIKIRQMCKQSC